MSEQNEKKRMHQGASYILYQNARQLRNRQTFAESILWEQLRLKRLDGFKFRRQHPIGIHILDFYCHQKKLGIEIDGSYHNDEKQILLDQERTEILAKQNIKIIRFSNEEVTHKLEIVLEKIKTELNLIS